MLFLFFVLSSINPVKVRARKVNQCIIKPLTWEHVFRYVYFFSKMEEQVKNLALKANLLELFMKMSLVYCFHLLDIMITVYFRLHPSKCNWQTLP